MMELHTVTATGSGVEDSKVMAGSSTIGCTESQIYPNDFEEFGDKGFFIDSSSSSNSSSNSLENFNVVDSYTSGPVAHTPDSTTVSYLPVPGTPAGNPAPGAPAPGTPAPGTLASDNPAPEAVATSLRMNFRSFKSLAKKSTSNWNDSHAHIIYASLGIKRYFVDADYILCPDIDHPKTRMVSKLTASKAALSGCTWSEIKPMIERIMSIFDSDIRKITDVHNQFAEFDHIKNVVIRNIGSLPPAKHLGRFRDLEKKWHECVIGFLDDIAQNCRDGKTTTKSYYEDFLFDLIFLFLNIAGNCGKVKQTFVCQDYGLYIPSLGRRQVPHPDLFLTTYCNKLIAVVEVKSPIRQPSRSANHQARSVPSSKRPKSKNLNDQDDDAGTDAASAMDVEDEELEAEMERENDRYEKMESLAEAKCVLPPDLTYMRSLSVEEKKQMRCFLPELLGQILASFPIEERSITTFRQRYAALRLGIAVVGFKVRFVSMVLKDKTENIARPTASDIVTLNSVIPYVYVTKELNLFHSKDLGIFFQTLFALFTLQ